MKVLKFMPLPGHGFFSTFQKRFYTPIKKKKKKNAPKK